MAKGSAVSEAINVLRGNEYPRAIGASGHYLSINHLALEATAYKQCAVARPFAPYMLRKSMLGQPTFHRKVDVAACE